MNQGITEPNFALLSRHKLESALARPVATFDGLFLHETLLERAAALVDGIPQAHAFQDGNKRVAWLSMLLYLDNNQVTIADMPQEEAADFVLSVVTHEHNVQSAVVWLADHID